MNKYRRLLLILGLVTLLTVVGVSTAMARNTWNGFHWERSSNPFTVSLGDNMNDAWDGFLSDSSSDWSLSTVLDTPIATGDGVCGMVAGTVQACNDRYGINGWLGLAQVDIDGAGHILWGRAKVNDSYFDTATYDNDNAKRHVLCQEIGHTLGLDHQKKRQARSCMNDNFGLFDARFDGPNGHDYSTLDDMYAHLDGVAPPPPSDDGGDFCDRKPNHRRCAGAATASANGDWGKAIGHDDKGRSNRFEKSLGGGLKRLTLVTWAN